MPDHVHCVMEFRYPITITTISNHLNIKSQYFELIKQKKPWGKGWVTDIGGGLSYLTHRNVTNKHVYSDDEVISKQLNEKDVPSPKDGVWNSSSVRGILMNEKYTGKIIIGKTYSNDPITDKRRRKNKGKKEMFIMDDYHEAIISQEDFDTVQQIMKRRGRARSLANTVTSENYGHMYPLSGKCKCGFCGSTAFRRTIHSSTIYQKVKWGCTTANKKGKAYCSDSKM